jgi:hypothetical protein
MARELLFCFSGWLYKWCEEGNEDRGETEMAQKKGFFLEMKLFLKSFWRNVRLYQLKRQVYALERRMSS